MDNEIQRILKGIEAIYMQLRKINERLDNPPAPIVIETPAPEPKQVYYNSKYPIKSITDAQLNSLENKILKFKPASERTNILIEFGVDQLNQLTSKQASDILKRYWGDKK